MWTLKKVELKGNAKGWTNKNQVDVLLAIKAKRANRIFFFQKSNTKSQSVRSQSVTDTAFLRTFGPVHNALVLAILVRARHSFYLAHSGALFAENYHSHKHVEHCFYFNQFGLIQRPIPPDRVQPLVVHQIKPGYTHNI